MTAITASKDAQQCRPIGWNSADWRVLAVVAVCAFLLFFPALGVMPIFDPSDGYYSEGAREMFESGNYLVPQLNYAPFFEKPILIYWLIIASYKIFGISEFAARVPAALSATFLVILTYAFARQFLRRRASLIATAILATSSLVLVVAHIAVTDMPLLLLFSISIGCLFLKLNGGRQWLKWPAYIALGLAVLCKGPVAALYVFISLGGYIACMSKSLADVWQSAKRLNLILGALLVVAIALPWFAAVTVATHGEFFNEFFIRQNIGRALGTVNHQAGPFYYIPVFFGGFFPWSIFLLAFAPLVTRIVLKARQHSPTRVERLGVLCAFVIAWMYPFFTVVSAKLHTYILPTFPSMALIVATCIDMLVRARKTKTLFVIGALLSIGSIAGCVLVPVLIKQPFIIPIAFGALVVLAVACLTFTTLLACRKTAKAVYVLPLVLAAACTVLVPLSLNAGYEMKLRDFHTFIWMMRDRGIVPAVWGRRSTSASFYLHKPVPYIELKKEYVSYIDKADPTKPLWILVAHDRLKHIGLSKRPTRIIETRGHWSLIVVDPAASVPTE